MKWMGILCISLACCGIGMYMAGRLRVRTLRMEKLTAFLEDCSTYIRYQSLPLEELLLLLSEQPNYRDFSFLKTVSQQISPSMPPQMLWHEAVRKDAAVEESAKEVLYSLGSVLGTTDTQGQLAALALHRTQMQTIAAQSREKNQKQGSLYRQLGFLTAAMMAVLLL
jgi:stage III sporulation protein AB